LAAVLLKEPDLAGLPAGRWNAQALRAAPGEGQLRGEQPARGFPDGRHLAFAAGIDRKTQLWIRDLNALAAWPLPGTDGAKAAASR